MSNFVHLHVHTYYSLLDGMGSPEERVLKAKELGMKAIAITDHNHLGGVLEFEKACKKHGIKPIYGVELYWTWDSNEISLPKEERDKLALDRAIEAGVEIPAKAKKTEIKNLIEPFQYDTRGYHIILFAKNQKGWSNLVKLQSEAADRGLFNGRYHCDNEMLKKYSEGLIVTTACIGSVFGRHIRDNKLGLAYNVFDTWVNIFGRENVYIEVQGLEWQEQGKVNEELIKMAKNYDVKVIATNDVHYTNKEDNDDHDTLLCIGTGKMKDDEERMRYDHEFWLRSYDEMIEAFKRYTPSQYTQEEYDNIIIEALENTNYLADQIDDNINLGSSVPLFTKTDLPKGMTNEKYLTTECWKALYKYLKKNPSFDRLEYEERLNWELHVINSKGYAPYMLTVEEFIAWANANGCPTGPGRGSAAGSLVLFLMGITKIIDPIQNGLLFSRFLTLDRTALPDVDVDFCYYGRDSVIEHLKEKYGNECVAHIGTYTEMGVKNGLKDVGRVLKVPFNVMNDISKKITELTDDAPGIKFKDLDKLEEEDPIKYAEFKKLEEANAEIFRLARRFEGTKRNFGVHASGVLVTPDAVNEIFPTRTVDGVKVTLYTGPQVEDCNGVKYDFLGLKTVSIIDRTLKAIDETLTWEDLYQAVELDDEGIFEMICNKETEAVFQIESDLFKGIISDMQPTHMNDIVVLTSLGRPGPLQAGMHTKYNNRKNGLEDIVMPVHSTEDIVGDTFGTIVYQEQVMAIAKKIAGFDDNQADSYLRKALAKKKVDMMNLCKRWLIHGKVNSEIPEGYDNNNPNSTMYDPTGKYGAEIKGAKFNNYEIKDLEAFWLDMEGYASYLFNKSHAACYSYITLLTAYLKRYYPVEFFASVLSIQDSEEKRANYISIAEKMGIEIQTPDINVSLRDFTPIAEENKILYGLGSIKGVGESAIPEIIANRPYASLEDMIAKIPKKALNKRVGVALIKSGALKEFKENRHELLNDFHILRKDKDELYDVATWDELTCIDFETKTLGAPITYKPWWSEVEAGETVEFFAKVEKVFEKIDKNGNMMGFVTLSSNGCVIDSVVFARTYCSKADLFDITFAEKYVMIKGKKDSKNKLIVSSVKAA